MDSMKLKSRTETADPKRVKAMLSLEDDAVSYKLVCDRITELSSEKDSLRGQLITSVEVVGNRDDKGNVVATTSKFKVTIQNRRTQKLDPDKAKEILKRLGLLAQCEYTEKLIDEREVALLVESGKLSTKDLEAMVNLRESKALVVKDLPQ